MISAVRKENTMCRKISAVFLSVLLTLFSALPVLAEGETDPTLSVESACWTNGKFIAYVRPEDGFDVTLPETGLMINNNMADAKGKLQTMKESGEPVRYMLLLDLSTSMPRYQKKIRAMAEALTETETQKFAVTVGGFGERFEILEEDLTDAEAVQKALSDVTCDHRATDIGGGVAEALKYLSGKYRKGTGPVNLIVLTDGIPYLAGNYDSEEEGIAETATAAAETIAKTPEVIVHTVGFADWNPTVLEAVSSGTGLDVSVSSAKEAKTVGTEIAGFVDSLYQTEVSSVWDFDADRMDVQLVLTYPESSDMQLIPINSVANIDRIPETDLSETPEVTILRPETGAGEAGDEAADEAGESEDDPGDAADEAGESEDDTDEAGGKDGESETDPGEPTGDGDETGDTSGKTEGEPDEAGTDAPDGSPQEGTDPEADTEGAKSTGGINRMVIGAIIAAALLVVVLVVVLIIRSRKRAGASRKNAGIAMKLEVISGHCKNPDKTYLLRDQITIGSSSSCDLIFMDKDIAPENARIFIQDQFIYIENTDPKANNTCLGGMRIYAPNRLRSGDEISIGSARFTFRF